MNTEPTYETDAWSELSNLLLLSQLQLQFWERYLTRSFKMALSFLMICLCSGILEVAAFSPRQSEKTSNIVAYYANHQKEARKQALIQFQAMADSIFAYHYSQKLGFNVDFNANKHLLIAASKWLGTPHSARNPKNGIDCSAFVRTVLKDTYGMQLNFSAAGMYEKAVVRVKKKELQQGDLVFFDTQGVGGVSHVGIYLQDGKFIHTSYSRGVMVNSLDEAYYANCYLGSGRPKELVSI
jgi:cell wall-associated NlpC family hydrolase